ncbi:unnamed protein product [Orchesella dallaii]
MCAQTGAGLGAWKRGNPPDHFIPFLGWHKRYGYYSIGAKKYDSEYAGVWRTTVYANVYFTHNLSFPADIFPREKQGDWESPFKAIHCPFKYEPRLVDMVDPCDRSNMFEMKMYAVKQSGPDGVERTMKGWLHIELKLLHPDDEFRIVYLQMRDEYFNAIGEFVSDPKEQCPSNDETLFTSPTSKQFLPCTATGLRETTSSQALYVVHPDILLDPEAKDPSKGYIPAGGLKKGIHFTWRYGEYWCNRHYMIRPDAFIITKKMIERRQATFKKYPGILERGDELEPHWDYPRFIRKTPKYWLRADWFGAHDIKLPSSRLRCEELIVEESSGEVTDAASWILDVVESSLLNDYLNPKYFYQGTPTTWFYQSCQANPQLKKPKDAAIFLGRCKHLFKTTDKNGTVQLLPSNSQLHTCNTNSSAREFEGINVTFANFESYKEYRENLSFNRSKQCDQPCRAPLNMTDVEEIQSFNVSGAIGFKINKTESNFTGRTKDSLAKFWRGRKFHGILCIICAMFVTPVSLFAARYLKETAMKYAFAGIQIWYWIHVANSLALFAIYYSSQTAIGPSIQSWGHSEDGFAIFHYIVGWISHAVLTAMIVFGGIRSGIYGSSVNVRKVFMTAHSIVGFGQYWVNIFLVLISTWIPASPTADACGEDGLPTGVSSVFIIVLSWAVFDILIHAAMTFLLFSVDTHLGIRRPWYCPILPILTGDSHQDMMGSFLRLIVFLNYVVISAGFTLGTILVISLQAQIPGCVFGEMSCKSPLGCTSAAVSMCRKLNYPDC